MSARKHRHSKAAGEGRPSGARRGADRDPSGGRDVPIVDETPVEREQAIFHDPLQDFDLTLTEKEAPPQTESLFDADLFARAAAAIKADATIMDAAHGVETPVVVTAPGSVAEKTDEESPVVARRGAPRGLLARIFGHRPERVISHEETIAEPNASEPTGVEADEVAVSVVEPTENMLSIAAVVGTGVEPDAAPSAAESDATPATGPDRDFAESAAPEAGALTDSAPVAEDASALDADAGVGEVVDEKPAADVDRRIVTRVRRRRSGRGHKMRSEGVESHAVSSPKRAVVPAWLAEARQVSARGFTTVMSVALVVILLLGALYGLAVGVNALARWNARRVAAAAGSLAGASDSVLVIGVRDGVAVGFTALKAERENKRVLGIAIPDGAFVEVPGQGFERIGASYLGGPDVSKDAVSNFLGVQFRRYVVVDGDTYQALLKDQNVAGLMAKATATDLPPQLRASLTSYLASVKPKDVWIVPLPVKPVAVGDQRYFEPQRSEVADLLLQWWGVKVSQQKATPRVIVYNGVGTPGLAGLASQQLIRTGFRVVNSGNAENFDYETTLILLYHGTQADAEAIRSILGVGEIKVQSAPQDLTDLIVIVGADYRPPVIDASTVPTEGVQ